MYIDEHQGYSQCGLCEAEMGTVSKREKTREEKIGLMNLGRAYNFQNGYIKILSRKVEDQRNDSVGEELATQA